MTAPRLKPESISCRSVRVHPADRHGMPIERDENQIFNTYGGRRVPVIGELVLEKLKIMDEVAYVRFASVYRDSRMWNTLPDGLENCLKEVDRKD